MSLEGQEADVPLCLEAARVKRELQWDSDNASYELDEEQELAPVVLKEELELGPVVLQLRDAVYAFQETCAISEPSRGCHRDHTCARVLVKEEVVECLREAAREASAGREEPADFGGPLEPRERSEGLGARRGTRRDPNSANVGNQIRAKTDIDTEEETFVCDICEQRFALKPRLVEHVVIHIHLSTEREESERGVADNASLKTEDKDSHAQTLLHGRCSVVLERVLVDLEALICTIGPQIHSFRFCEQKRDIQASTEINPRNNKISQIRLLAAKKTKSAKTRKPKVPVEEKKAKPSGKIAKHNSTANKRKIGEKKEKPNKKIAKTNSAKINPRISTASQDWSSSTDLQEATPEKPAGSSPSSGVNILTAETNFQCEKCGKGFNIKSDLEKHLNTHMLMEASTSHKASKFTCKTCNCTFDTKLLLQEHEKSRHDVKYFACAKCEYATKHARNLPAHLRTHTGEKPFKCSHFSSAFTQSSNLKLHLRTHTGEKAYKCSLCSSAFTVRCNLQEHLRTHTGEKAYKCSLCSSAFTVRCNLQEHLRTHTGEKPFECNISDYKTTQSGALQDHLMSRHSGQKPFGCDACSYSGATRGHLRHHMKAHHNSA